jgi:hypothetical protein
VPPAIDITGQPLRRDVSQVGGMNPFFRTKATDDPVVKELARLGIATPQTPCGKQTPQSEDEPIIGGAGG